VFNFQRREAAWYHLGFYAKVSTTGLLKIKREKSYCHVRKNQLYHAEYMGVRVATITERNISLLTLRFGVRVIAGMDSLGDMRIPLFDTKETTGLYG
jgi:hypothetical protein